VAAHFGLSNAQARRIASETGAAVSRWRAEAARLEIPANAVERMESAFEHRDLQRAIAHMS
jgi:serine/threonine-protein kinase HipA